MQPAGILNDKDLWFMPVNGHAHYRFVDYTDSDHGKLWVGKLIEGEMLDAMPRRLA